MTPEQATELYEAKKYISFRFQIYDGTNQNYYGARINKTEADKYSNQMVNLKENVQTTNISYYYRYDRDYLRYDVNLLNDLNDHISIYIKKSSKEGTEFSEFLTLIPEFPDSYQYYLGTLEPDTKYVTLYVFIDLEIFIKAYNDKKYLSKTAVALLQKYATNQFKIYNLQDCSDEPEYSEINPAFLLKLFDYQKQSLAWMTRIENQDYKFLVPKSSFFKLTNKAYIELSNSKASSTESLTANYVFENDYQTSEMIRCRGGILADDLGNGKTITCIAHMYHNRPMTAPLLTTIVEREVYVASRATLVVCPTNILTQWESEIEKCLGSNYGGLKVLKISTKAQMNRYTMADFVSADVIITSYDWLTHTNHIGTGFIKKGRSAELLSLQKQNKILYGDKYEKYTNSTLLFIKYYRIYYDEFHEQIQTKSTQNLVLHIIKHCLKGKNIFGISGTPLLEDDEIMANIPHLLQIKDTHNQIYELDVVSQHEVFKRYVRRNEKSYLPPITYRMVPIRQTIQEKQLYDSNKSQDIETLLQLCSYHNLNGLDSQSIEDVSKSQDKLRQKQKLELEEKINDLEINRQQLETVIRSMNPKIKKISELYYLIDPKDPKHTHALTQQIANSANLQFQVQSLRQFRKYEQDQEKRREELKNLQQCIDYYNQTLKLSLVNGQFVCPITGDMVGSGSVVITKDGHLFSKEAIEMLFDMAGGSGDHKSISCPVTGNLLRRADITVVNNGGPTNQEEKETNQNQRLFGSKIAAIIEEIKRLDPSEKVIIFSKWDKLIHTIAYALEHCGISTVCIRGAVGSRDKSIREFQTNPKLRAILLSSDYGASGVNLTQGTHVYIVHPFVGEAGLQYEKQAICRAYRTGQTKPVTVSFFIMENTIEQEMWNAHRKQHYISK